MGGSPPWAITGNGEAVSATKSKANNNTRDGRNTMFRRGTSLSCHTFIAAVAIPATKTWGKRLSTAGECRGATLRVTSRRSFCRSVIARAGKNPTDLSRFSSEIPWQEANVPRCDQDHTPPGLEFLWCCQLSRHWGQGRNHGVQDTAGPLIQHFLLTRHPVCARDRLTRHEETAS